VWTCGKRIGATDAFTWQDGSSIASPGYFTNWAPGFPHSNDSSRACVQLIRATGQWEDVSCSSTLNYVLCQKNLQLDIWKLQDIVIQTRSQLWGYIIYVYFYSWVLLKLITLHFILYQLSERTAELEKTRSDLLVLRSEVMTKLPLIEMQVTSLSTNVEDLHDGLSGTNTTVSTLRGEFDELKTNFDVDTTSLRTDLSAKQGHVMTLPLDQERNQRDLVLLTSDLTKVSGRTTGLESVVTKLLLDLDETDNQLDLTNLDVKELRESLTATDGKVNTLKDEFDQLKNDFVDGTSSLRADLTTTQGHVMTLPLDQERNQRDLVLLTSDLTKVSGRTTGLESVVTKLLLDLDETDNQLDLTNLDVKELRESLTATDGKVNTLKDEFDQLKNDFVDGTSSLRADLTTTQGHVVTMRSDLSVTQDHVVTLDAKLDGASRELQQVKSDLEKLDTRVKTIEEAGSPGDPELGPVYGKIEEVENTLLAADEIIRGELEKATVTLGENPEQLTSQKTTLYEHTLLVKDHGKRLGDAETNIISLGEANDIAVNEIPILKKHAGKVDQNLERTERRVELFEVEVESIKKNLDS
jgi:chromosome segregation ATPase